MGAGPHPYPWMRMLRFRKGRSFPGAHSPGGLRPSPDCPGSRPIRVPSLHLECSPAPSPIHPCPRHRQRLFWCLVFPPRGWISTTEPGYPSLGCQDLAEGVLPTSRGWGTYMLLNLPPETHRGPHHQRLTQPPNISDTKIKRAYILGTSSLLGQWLRLLLPMQGIQV